MFINLLKRVESDVVKTSKVALEGGSGFASRGRIRVRAVTSRNIKQIARTETGARSARLNVSFGTLSHTLSCHYCQDALAAPFASPSSMIKEDRSE